MMQKKACGRCMFFCVFVFMGGFLKGKNCKIPYRRHSYSMIAWRKIQLRHSLHAWVARKRGRII